jgi:hypothetical protein
VKCQHPHQQHSYQQRQWWNLVVPNGVERIDPRVFNRCKRMSMLQLPSTLHTIGDHAFSMCEGLQHPLILPEGIAVVGAGAFEWCVNLPSVKFSTGLTRIEQDAFRSCDSLSGETAIFPFYHVVFCVLESTCHCSPKKSRSSPRVCGTHPWAQPMTHGAI